ncbi:hypothetical protein G6M89_13790 [Natronolimnobius sp. AArcel1]|uniref:DUF7093 family protein n=1 Tax=Natronolimnobius sp. AArcel1 TaxID=1679093 RepID=UPI0013EAE94D|nr:hypothetical protein [Natronolimnobius sp. AArcel1]NGM70064.1 hypothetical protein [Natronolimnobius sp. AArcel1]
MVLRCSLLGHDYGDPDIEREREERGSEVVVTVQEYEECARCGDRHVISENTEVTSLSMADDSLESPSEADQSAETANARTDPPSPDEPGTDGRDAVFIDDEADQNPDPDDAGATSSPDTSAPADTADADSDTAYPTDENGEPITDDGEILEDSDDEPARERNRERGEWPETDDVGPPVGAENDPAAWPDTDDEPPVEDDAVVLENDSGTDDDSDETAVKSDTVDGADSAGDATTDEEVSVRDLAAGRKPAAVAGGDAEAEQSTAESVPDSGIERAADAPVPAEDTGPARDVPMEYFCPRCEFVAAETRASLRAGDICPDCRKGYLGERPQR